jgi:hypothetical protein
MAGIYKIPEHLMVAESGIPAEDLSQALEDLAALDFLHYEGGVLWVRSRVKHLRTKTPQIAKSIANDLEAISDTHPLKYRFVQAYQSLYWLAGVLPNVEAPSRAKTGDPHPNVGDPPGQGQGQGKGSIGVVSISAVETSLSSKLESNEGEEEGDPVADQVREIFEYWQLECKHHGAKPSPDRVRKVRARLREGYTVHQIKEAIDGAARGATVDENGKVWDDLELICRSGSKLESFIGRPARKKKTTEQRASSLRGVRSTAA